ncbi:MAG: 23S rRNA (adenine(2503)-C(2))-methyltransferase RlmN [Bacteroidales bacterium]|nr:23S rRNA (adenine(2503)-C(2))-methyltransferase RlmN [Bacteroidales bacterium]
MSKPDIYGKTLTELREITYSLNLPSYTGLQLCDWLYKKHALSFNQMSNLSKQTRKILSDHFVLKRALPSDVQNSQDGARKYLFPVRENKTIESVYIPEKNRNTLCISSQIGCKMDCVFCMTGKQGFQGNLTSGEIINQISSLPERDLITNTVFMGMGEPLGNTENVIKSIEIMTSDYGFGWSPSRITLSTIGLLPGLERIIQETNCHLAVSLHTPFEDERLSLMPAEKFFPVKKTIEFLKKNRFKRQRRISFEYIMFDGINDTMRHVNGLAKLLNGLKCRINLIRYHEIPGVQLHSSSEEKILLFQKRLNEKGIITTIRASRGEDIFAACGMLSTLNNQNEENIVLPDEGS